MNYNQYVSVNSAGGYVYSKEVHTLTREVELKRIKNYDWKFFIQDPDKKGKFTDVKGNCLRSVTAKSIKEFKEKIKSFNDYGHKVYGTDRLAYQYIYNEFDKTKFNNKLVRIGFFDIETARDDETGYSPATVAANPITAISLVINGHIYYWATKDLPSSFADDCTAEFDWFKPNKFEFFWSYTEYDMLEHFIKFFVDNIDVISGWNIELYDITYLVTRSANLGLDPKKLSPFGIIKKKEFTGKFGKIDTTYEILGVQVLDYINLYKKFTYKTPDNYQLSTIAQNELGDDKINYSEHRNLEELYHEDFVKFSKYSIKDSTICDRLENKLKLIELAITLSYKTGVNFEDSLGTVKMWTFYLHQEMMDANIVPPMFSTQHPSSSIVGGHVKDPIRGKHKWVMSFDLASLYPHNQMGMNISFDKLLEDSELPEDILRLKDEINQKYKSVDSSIDAIVNKEIDLSLLKKYNIGMAPNVQFYRNDSLGIIPKVLKRVYNERKEVKKEMLVRKQELVNLKDKYKHWEDE